MNMTRKAWLVPVLAAAALCRGTTLAAQDQKEGNQAALAKAVLSARVSLESGLAASASHGQPISAKFEIEEGKLQLSVYTVKGGKSFEVIVDHNTGKVVKAEPVTAGEDYTAAQSQNAAMAGAKVSLSAALARAASANKGYRAVSIYPSLKDGHPVAEITLVKGEEVKTVSQALD